MANTEKKPKYTYNSKVSDGRWVRAWSEGKGRNKEFMVQVWNNGTGEGEPDGDWAMPGILGLSTSIAQAVIQTEVKK